MNYGNPLQRIINASRYSLDGLAYALKHEQAFRYEAVVLVIVCTVMVIVDIPALQGVIFAGAWLVVMCLELVNSAAEKIFDLLTEDYSPIVKAGKDMLSASVFLGICFNIILWVVAIISHSN
ncbi:MAG: diacylglycerol kinase [Synergistaceae bacterium]|nr:diacylglycerol kinase [Synergistaceae bacterium]